MLAAAGMVRAQTVTCTVPNLLQNGTVADANQVMGNFTTIAGCVNTVSTNSSSVGNQFDIANYGAVGDSVTDDSQHIANAFTACGTAGGGTVIVKPSTTGKMYVIQHANLITAAWSGACGLKFIGGHYWPANFYDTRRRIGRSRAHGSGARTRSIHAPRCHHPARASSAGTGGTHSPRRPPRPAALRHAFMGLAGRQRHIRRRSRQTGRPISTRFKTT